MSVIDIQKRYIKTP